MRRILEGLDKRIANCDSIGQLRALRDQIQEKLHDCLLFTDAVEWTRLANEFHDWLIRQTIQVAEAQLRMKISERPSGGYAFILFGSAGRREQTLYSDQDNGIIYQGEDPETEFYYKQLSAAIEDAFTQVGYPPCEGGVGAGNEQWRKSAAQWFAMLAEWFQDGSWENVRQLLVVADARIIYGDSALVDQLKCEYQRLVAQTPGSIEAMRHNTLRHKVVLGPLGNLIREPYGEDAGGFDIKYGAYIPMVNAIRLLSIIHNITETSTLGRLDRLRGHLGTAKTDRIRGAFIQILKLRAMAPYQVSAEGYYTSRGKLRPQDLTKAIIAKLKLSLRIGEELQRYIRKLV